MLIEVNVWDDWMVIGNRGNLFPVYINPRYIIIMRTYDQRRHSDGTVEMIYIIRGEKYEYYTPETPEEIIIKGTMNARPLPTVHP